MGKKAAPPPVKEEAAGFTFGRPAQEDVLSPRLPRELNVLVFSHLNALQLQEVRLVSRGWRAFVDGCPELWESITLSPSCLGTSFFQEEHDLMPALASLLRFASARAKGGMRKVDARDCQDLPYQPLLKLAEENPRIVELALRGAYVSDEVMQYIFKNGPLELKVR